MKTDITVSKQATINTGNYSSIRPSTSMTIKDVDIEDSKNAYEALNKIINALFAEEMIDLMDFKKQMKEHGLDDFTKLLIEMREYRTNTIIEAMETLQGLGNG